MRASALFCVGALAGALIDPVAAAPQDSLAECEQHAMAFYRAHDAKLKSLKIDRSSVIHNRFDDKVGRQCVSSEYIGWAQAVWSDRETRERFVCLHEGEGKKAAYVTIIPR